MWRKRQRGGFPISVSDNSNDTGSVADLCVDAHLAECMDDNAGRPAADVNAMTPAEARAVYAQSREMWNTGEPAMAEVRRNMMHLDAVEMPAVTFVPDDAGPGATVFLHGGGWVMGGTATHDGIMRRLADLTRRPVIGLDYPLAPDARRPATVRACTAAISRIIEDSEGPVVVAGDSAGAELSLSATLALRDAGATLPDGLCLAYPALWPRFETESHNRSGDGRFGLSTETMRGFWQHYLGDGEALPASPDLSGLPRCYILGAALDPLLDDAVDLAGLLKAAGVDCELHVPGGSTHGFLHYSAVAPIAMDALAAMARFIRSPTG